MPPRPEPTKPGQESVWDYPRPPRVEAADRHVLVRFNGRVVAESRRPILVKETSHPPVYFIPRADVRMGLLRPAGRTSFCEWKGRAAYYDVVAGERIACGAAFGYPEPTAGAEAIAGAIAFYAGPMDEITVDGHRVAPQPGGFYAGWITPELAGPFKGGPGTMGW